MRVTMTKGYVDSLTRWRDIAGSEAPPASLQFLGYPDLVLAWRNTWWSRADAISIASAGTYRHASSRTRRWAASTK